MKQGKCRACTELTNEIEVMSSTVTMQIDDDN
jgi:hypothetical protein